MFSTVKRIRQRLPVVEVNNSAQAHGEVPEILPALANFQSSPGVSHASDCICFSATQITPHKDRPMIKEFFFGGAGSATKLGDTGLFIMRVFAGSAMAVTHGLMKIQNPDKAISSATNLHFPVPVLFGWAAILSEFLGGILLALGLLTRPAAFFIASTMVVAAFMQNGAAPFDKKELALVYLAMMVYFLFNGGGRFSVDAAIRK